MILIMYPMDKVTFILHDEILDLLNLKAIADDKFQVNKLTKFVLDNGNKKIIPALSFSHQCNFSKGIFFGVVNPGSI